MIRIVRRAWTLLGLLAPRPGAPARASFAQTHPRVEFALGVPFTVVLDVATLPVQSVGALVLLSTGH